MPKQAGHKFGIRARLFTSLLSLLLLSFGLTGFILLSDAEKQIDEFRQTQVKYQAKTLAEGSLDGLVAGDYSLLERWVASSLPSKEYAYACLVSLDGKVLSHTNMSMIGKNIATPENIDETVVRNIEYLERPVKEAVFPAKIGEKHLANAHVAYYTDTQFKQGNLTLERLVLILTITTLLLVIGIYTITNIMINPIKKLTTVVSKFTIDKEVVIDKEIMARSDEIGVLSQTFHKLFQKLALSYKDLEDRVHDRTKELRVANDELRQSETRIKAIMEHVADAVVCINESGVILSYNNSASNLFGYSKEEVLGNSVSMLMPRPFSDNHDSYVSNYLNTGASKKMAVRARELSGRNKDGSVFPMEISVNELIAKDGHIFIAIMRDITERKKEFDDLHYYANHDVLTGLYNRKYFMHELEQIVERARRSSKANCALLYIDLDRFKYVNDNMGHAAGDQVLCDVTKIMKERTRKSDILARLGGDEFAIILYDTSIDVVDKIANSFRSKLDKYKYIQDGQIANIGCSIGVAMIHPEYKTAEEVLADADGACYDAKRNGRNQVSIFNKMTSSG